MIYRVVNLTMDNSLVRHYILSVLLEEKGNVDMLRQWAEGSDDPLVHWLISHDIVPIPSGEKDSFLGKGIAARAYEVVWRGKRHVAKFIPTNESPIYTKAMEIKQHVPRVYGRHLPTIFEIFNVDEKTTREAGDVYNKEFNRCVLVEYLIPVPRNVASSLWKSKSKDTRADITQKRMSGLTKNSSLLNKLTKGVLSSMHADEALSPFVRNVVVSTIDDLTIADELYEPGTKPDEISNIVDFYVSTNVKHAGSEAGAFIDDDFDWNEFSHILKGMLLNIVLGRIFPTSRRYGDNPQLAKSFIDDRNVQSLVRTLEYLEETYEFEWHDLHESNIMVRPDTGELVISDVGLFGA